MTRALFVVMMLFLGLFPVGASAKDYRLNTSAKPDIWSPTQDQAVGAARTMCTFNLHRECAAIGGTITGPVDYTGYWGNMYCDLGNSGGYQVWKCSIDCNARCRRRGL